MDIQVKVLDEKRRGDCYRFLAACFYPPRKELFLKEHLLKNLTSTLGQVCPEAVLFSEKMEKAFLDYAGEDLSVEYARLFVGPFELKAPPYGSVYLDHERRVMGDSTIEVIRLYGEAGLTIDEDFKELPDHIAVELEFMYYLTYQEVKALEKGEAEMVSRARETRELFLNQYFRTWVPRFCEKIKEGTDNSFYTALADCLLTFIRQSQPT